MYDGFQEIFTIVILHLIIIISILSFCLFIFCYIVAYKKQQRLKCIIAPEDNTIHVNTMRIIQEKIMRVI